MDLRIGNFFGRRIVAVFWMVLTCVAGSAPQAIAQQNSRSGDGVFRIFVVAQFSPPPQQAGQTSNATPPVEAGDATRTTGTGTGFLVSGRRMVLTNNHVVSLIRRVDTQVVRPTESTFLIGLIRNNKAVLIRARLVDTQPEKDMALLEASEDLPGTAITLADFDASRDIDVEAIGFPGLADFAIELSTNTMQDLDPSQLEPIKTQGRLQRIFDLNAALISGRPLTARVNLHTAAISGGNSGGPLFDRCGYVIGVNTFTASNSQTAAAVSHAVSSVEVVRFLAARNVPIRTSHSACWLPGTVGDYVTLTNFFGLSSLLLALTSIFLVITRPQVVQQTVSRVQNTFSRVNVSPPTPPRAASPRATPAAVPRRDAGGNGRAMVRTGTSVQLVPLAGGAPLDIDISWLADGRGVVVGRSLELLQLRDPLDHPMEIADHTVSRRHARLTLGEKNHLRVEDLGSTIGTFRGDAPIQTADFSDGEEVRFGAVKYRIKLPPGG